VNGVLVTGATTPIGNELLRRLAEDPRVGHLLAVGVEPEGRARLPEVGHELTYLRVDLTRSREVRTLLFGPARDLGVGTILHAALHRRATDTGRRVHAQNVESTRALLHLAERHPTIRRFVLQSAGAVYRLRCDQPTILLEDHPLEHSPRAPEWVRDRVEADLMVCARMGLSPLHITVLRCAECLAPSCGSQLYDFLQSRVCLRPLGFDPVVNVLSVEDAARALHLALDAREQGVFNIPGRDTLPLSVAIQKWGDMDVPLPGPLLDPLYELRRWVRGTDFRYDLNRTRFHFGGILDGSRARRELGYVPERAIDWPRDGAAGRPEGMHVARLASALGKRAHLLRDPAREVA